jgi:hypothetical protein
MRRNFDTADAIRPVAQRLAASEPPDEVVEAAKRIPVVLRSGYDEFGRWQEEEEAEELCVRCHQWPCNCVRDERDAEDERVPDEDCGCFVQSADVEF